MKFFKVYNDEKSQAIVEYALLLVFIVFLMIVIFDHPYVYKKFRLDLLQIENMILRIVGQY